jgi:hypothetical protein
MATITYYVALPFAWKVEEDDEVLAELAPCDPVECESAEAAVAMAEYLATTFIGSIAFTRSGDTDTGVFDDAVVLAQFGEIGAVE